MKKRLTSEKVSKVLDRTTEGGYYKQIADEAGVSPSSVYSILRDFPLWAYFRDKVKEARTED